MGALVSAAALSLPLAGAAFLLQNIVPERVRLFVVMAGLAVFAAVDLGLLPFSARGIPRQTSSTIYRIIGSRITWFVWGVDLGQGWSTIRASSLYWGYVLWLVLIVPPLWIWAACMSYAVGLTASLALPFLLRRRSNVKQLKNWLPTRLVQTSAFARACGGVLEILLVLGLAVWLYD